MWFRIQSLNQIGWELTEIKAFEVVGIIWDFEWLRFVVVSYTLLWLVMRCRIQSMTQIGRELTEIKVFKVVQISWDFEIWSGGISWDLLWYHILC